MNILEKEFIQPNLWKVLSFKFNITLFFLFLPSLMYGQGQSPSSGQGVFDTNYISTLVGPGGFMWDLNNAQYEVPKDSGKHSIFAHDHWLGGVDDGGALRLAAMTYRQGGNDLWAGPCSNQPVHGTGAYSQKWDRVWKINIDEIQNHIFNHSMPNYQMPEAIENWPAHGDTLLGQEFHLAPFIDINNNGIYEPQIGDYPKVKGHQSLYMIRNDIGNIHTESQCDPIGIEQHLMFYGYRCDNVPALNYTLFAEMKLYNRGTNNMNDFYVGTWTDTDLGYYLDDYVGCNVNKNLGFCYNGDAIDEGAQGYGFNPPAQGLVYLNDDMEHFMYYYNNSTVIGNPSQGIHFYNYLRGIWKDNVPLTFGGDGHGGGNGATTDQCNYMFPNLTDPQFPNTPWTEVTSGNIPSDRRFLMSAGPIYLGSGDMYHLDYAFVWARDSGGGNLASVNLLFNYVDDIKSFYQNPTPNICVILGCTDSTASNYNPLATQDDGSCCISGINGGCTDITAINYNSSASCDDGSCNYIGVEITRIEGSGNGSISLDLSQQSIDEIFSGGNDRVLHPTYKINGGPLNISVVDSVNIITGTYSLRLQDPVLNNANSIISYNKWIILDSLGNLVDSSNSSIDFSNQKFISQIGAYVNIIQAKNPSSDPLTYLDNGLISGQIEFDNPHDKWLTGVPDRDDETADSVMWGLNWIRSGSYDGSSSTLGAPLGDYNIADDPNGVYESVVLQNISDSLLFNNTDFTGGTWAPYRLSSYFWDGPGISSTVTNQNRFTKLNSVDIVFTSDTSKWTRSCVVEAQDDPNLSILGQVKMGLRQSPSVDKNGNPDNSGTMGMGWFPGYAIDLETGERLNIIFSEDSWLTSENGSDMMWNPTSNIITPLFPYLDQNVPPLGDISGGSYLLGGKHYIYVVSGSNWVKGTDDYISGNFDDVDNSPNYDSGQWIYNQLSNDQTGVGKWSVFQNVTWVGLPLLAKGSTLLSNQATVKLRVTKPYRQYETVAADKILDKNTSLNIGSTYVVAYGNETPPLISTWGGQSITHDGNTYQPGDIFSATSSSFSGSSKARVIEHNSINSFNPIYSFNTNEIYAEKQKLIASENRIKDINVVPNPYYGYSNYETNQIDNRVKITNLPRNATISIYTVSGTLVKTIKKDDDMASIDWDLKNNYGIPVASGLYVFHVRTSLWDSQKNEMVEKDKVIKWFGALRPVDLDTF